MLKEFQLENEMLSREHLSGIQRCHPKRCLVILGVIIAWMIPMFALAQDESSAVIRIGNKPSIAVSSVAEIKPNAQPSGTIPLDQAYAILLGITQDAGYPQAGCQKECCRAAWADPSLQRHAACLAIVDPSTRQRFLIECTPDFKHQLQLLNELTWRPEPGSLPLDAILITHAHIGHYAGLIHLGREAMGTQGLPLYVMPRMHKFLTDNGPWSQLVNLNNVQLRPLANGQPLQLNDRLSVTPILVPHRGEYSETVAFLISGPQARVLFLPDIDRWEDWDREVEDVIKDCDIALLDGTFLADGELPGRDMSTIPHPTIEHSVTRFEKLPLSERQKIHFIHLNHTNPLLHRQSDHPMSKRLDESGMRVGEQGQVFLLGK